MNSKTYDSWIQYHPATADKAGRGDRGNLKNFFDTALYIVTFPVVAGLGVAAMMIKLADRVVDMWSLE